MPIVRLDPVGVRGLRSARVEGASKAAQPIANLEFLDGLLLAVGYGHAGQICMQGTGTMIAPGLVLTAGHNFHPAFDDRPHMRDTEPLIAAMRDGYPTQLWSLNGAQRPGPTRGPKVGYRGEIAYMSIEPYRHKPSLVSTLPLTTRIPEVGEQLTAIGLRFTDGDPSKFEGAFASTGRLAEIKHTWLENSRQYPALEIECEVLHGMSGGPVLDEQGYIVGVVSTGFEDRAWAAMVIHGLGSQAELRIPWPPDEYGETVRVMDIPNSRLYIQHRERIFSADDTNIFVSLEPDRTDFVPGPLPKPYDPDEP